jgi:hypothetical protein
MFAVVAALVGTLLIAPVDWRAPAECPDAADVERRARALGPAIADVPLRAEVLSQDGGFELRLSAADAPPHTYFDHRRSCCSEARWASMCFA